MAILFSPYSDPTRIYDGTDTRAFALLIGAALALALPRARTYPPVTVGARRLLDAAGAVALGGIFIMFWRTGEYDAFLYRGGMVLLSLLTAVVIAVIVHPGARFGRLLAVEPLRWIGERSYGIYLWHYPVIVLTTPANAAPNVVRALLQIAASIGLAALSWRYVEQPVRHGALPRQWRRLRAHHWTWPPRLRPAEWAVAGGVTVNTAVCLVGLCGLVSVPALAAAAHHRTVLPPAHHHEAAATSTTAVPGGPTTTTAPPPPGQGVTAIGDSVLVDAATDLQHLLPGIVIDAKVGQQLYQVQSTVPLAQGQRRHRDTGGDRARHQRALLGGPADRPAQLPRAAAGGRAHQHPGAATLADTGQHHHRHSGQDLPPRHPAQLVRGERRQPAGLLHRRHPPEPRGVPVLRHAHRQRAGRRPAPAPRRPPRPGGVAPREP